MTAYYNENDPKAAAWLRELIKAGAIAPGQVDERDVRDVRPAELDGFIQCHFFAGIGVWSYALRLAGWSDSEPVWTGSCPCQPFSQAGKGGGFDDERHLWPAWFHLLEECHPPVIFGEQVASPDGLAWLDLVQTDLEATGHAFAPIDLCAAGVGAPHIRQRLYWVADAERDADRGKTATAYNQSPEADRSSNWIGRYRSTLSHWSACDWLPCRDGKARPVEPGSFPLAHGTPARVGRLRGYGNALVAHQAAAFIASYREVACG